MTNFLQCNIIVLSALPTEVSSVKDSVGHKRKSKFLFTMRKIFVNYICVALPTSVPSSVEI